MPSLQFVYKRSNNRVSYSSPVTANAIGGTEITELTSTITLKDPRSIILIKLNITCESNDQANNIFRLVRSVPGLPDVYVGNNTTDNGRWAGWAHQGYDQDDSTTPRTNHHVLIDTPRTNLPVTYKFLTAATAGTAYTFFLNRDVRAIGADIDEVGISQVILQEFI